MNFTLGKVRYVCMQCHLPIAHLSFKRWNELHHLAQNPPRPERPASERPRPARKDHPRRPQERRNCFQEDKKQETQRPKDRIYQKNLPDK